MTRTEIKHKARPINCLRLFYNSDILAELSLGHRGDRDCGKIKDEGIHADFVVDTAGSFAVRAFGHFDFITDTYICN